MSKQRNERVEMTQQADNVVPIGRSTVGPAPCGAHRPRVVIVGAGFAGLHAAHELSHADVDVTIVDRNNFHTFQPLLYQVTTGVLAAEDIGVPVRQIFRRQPNVTMRVGEVESIDWNGRTVALADGSLPFDYLVVAAGVTANYLGIPGMREHAWPLYALGDAIRLRAHLLTEIERQTRLGAGGNGDGDEVAEATGPDAGGTTVVVVGGGATGLEMAGALVSMAGVVGFEAGSGLRVILLEAADRLLGTFGKRSSQRALVELRRRGVEVRLGTPVAAVDAEGVTLKSGDRIDAATVVWAAGVQARAAAGMLGVLRGKLGGVVVGADLQVPGQPGVFVAGDMSATEGKPLPLVAPVAIQQGRHAGRQINRLLAGKPTRAFRYRNKGSMAVLGAGASVAEVPIPLPGRPLTVSFGGFIAWLLWLGVHIVYLVGFRNRIKVLVGWGWSYLAKRGSGGILLPTADDRPHPADIL